MKVYSLTEGNGYDGTDYDFAVRVIWGADAREIINQYINEHKISKKYFSDNYGLSYNSFLKFMKGWDYCGEYTYTCRRIIQNKESIENMNKYGYKFNNCEIDFIKLFCNVLKQKNKTSIKIGGTSHTNNFNNIIKYLSDNSINIEIANSFNGRGDHDPYIIFKINEYNINKIEEILKIFSK